MEQGNEDEQDVFQEKNHMPFWYHRVYFKRYYVISAILFVFFIMIIVIALIVSTSNSVVADKSGSKDNLQGKLIILVNGSKLMSFTPKSRSLSLLLDMSTFCPSAYFRYLDIRVDGLIYCHQENNSSVTEKNNNSLHTLSKDRRLSVSSFTLDDVTQNLYMLEMFNGYLMVMDAKKKYFNVLLSNLHSINNMVFDYNEGLMFILSNKSSILRANMDGSELKEIVVSKYTLALSINVHRQRLYWTSLLRDVESADYDGNDRRSVYATGDAHAPVIYKMTVLDDSLYWLKSSSALFSCKLNDRDECEDVEFHDIGQVETVQFIKAFSSSSASVTNPCRIENGGCQHLCLIKGKNSHSCACQMGWELNPDKRTCRKVHDYLMYVKNDRIKVTDMSGSKDLIFPTAYEIEPLKFKEDVSFDYDMPNDDLYYSDDFNVYRMKLKSSSNRTLVLSSQAENAVIDDVAHDWYTGNLYISQREKSLSDRHSLIVLRVRKTGVLRKTLYSSPYDRNSPFESCPYAIALHPSRGHVFFAGVIDAQAHICTLHANGTKFHFTRDPFMLFAHNCPFASVDHSSHRLYWIFATDEITMVAHSEFDGSDLSYVVVEDVSRARIVHAHRAWIYLSNRTSVWRVNKKTGRDVVMIASTDGTGGKKLGPMKIISGEVQFGGRRSHCEENNGGCEQFCYAKPELSCDCQSDQKAQSDGRCL